MTDHETGGKVDPACSGCAGITHTHTCGPLGRFIDALLRKGYDPKLTIMRDAVEAFEAAGIGITAQTMQWQPRETAPKTGKPFLAFFPDGDFTPETGIDVIWWEPSEERFLIGGLPIIWKFTHWTPLPTAPAIPSTLLGTPEDRTDGR